MATDNDVQIAVMQERHKTIEERLNGLYELETKLYKHIDDKFNSMQKVLVCVLILGLGGNSEIASTVLKTYLGVDNGAFTNLKRSKHTETTE